MSTQEQANRTADRILEHGVMRRREALLRQLHRMDDHGYCVAGCEWIPAAEGHCETTRVLNSIPPIVTEE